MSDIIRTILEGLFFPLAIGLIIWAVTQRNKDRSTIASTLAQAGKTLAEGDKTEAEAEIARETVDAAVRLADIKTIQEGVSAMAASFREERESLQRALDRATQTADTCIERQTELSLQFDDTRADVERYHREVLDMYRRDLYHANALQALTDWVTVVAPILQELRPDLPKPPKIEPLPPLHIHSEEDVPNRRWYDNEPAVDPSDQEI